MTKAKNVFFVSSAREDGRAITGFDPQIIPENAPNIFHLIEVFRLSFVFVCFFSCQIARGRRPILTLTLTRTQNKAPTRAQLSLRVLKKTEKKCADHHKH